MTNAYQETRIGLVRRIALAALTARELNLMTFADTFVARAYELAPVAFSQTNMRLPHPTDATQHEKDRLHNRQIVERWTRGEVAKFPHELEEPWVLALPAEWQERALAELSARYGLLAARAPEATTSIASLGAATEDFGKFIGTMGPILADGVIDENDLPHIKPALEHLIRVQAELASLAQQLARALPDESSKVTRLRA